MIFLSSTECIYKINSAQGSGGVFRLTGPHTLSSDNNVYIRNIFGDFVMAEDIITSNIGTTIEAGGLNNIYISDTEFMNRSDYLHSCS